MQTDGLKQVRELAKVMQTGLFADRETLEDAFNYMHQVASGCNNSVAVLTAVHVVLNTAAKLIEKECNKEIEYEKECNKEIEAVELHHSSARCIFAEYCRKSRAYDPDPKQMAAADRLNAAFFSNELAARGAAIWARELSRDAV